ncbi:MAG: hypothetical protein Q4C12_06575 [Clostridia bacterium]|nr:hypothetical protein [Clostridia bacterium]
MIVDFLCWFDMPFSLDKCMGEEQFVRIVRAHGANKILFAADWTWGRADETIKILMAASLEKESILGANAAGMLCIV